MRCTENEVHVFVDEHKTKKIGREGGYFRDICFGRMGVGVGEFFA